MIKAGKKRLAFRTDAARAEKTKGAFRKRKKTQKVKSFGKGCNSLLFFGETP